jgi:hypothetical protein
MHQAVGEDVVDMGMAVQVMVDSWVRSGFDGNGMD